MLKLLKQLIFKSLKQITQELDSAITESHKLLRAASITEAESQSLLEIMSGYSLLEEDEADTYIKQTFFKLYSKAHEPFVNMLHDLRFDIAMLTKDERIQLNAYLGIRNAEWNSAANNHANLTLRQISTILNQATIDEGIFIAPPIPGEQ